MTRVFERILIATDFSEAAEPAQRVGVGLAQHLGAQGTLFHALTATPPLTLLDQPYAVWSDTTAEAQAVRKVRKALEQAAVDMPDCVQIDAVAGDSPAREICTHAADHDIDLIVTGSHGRTGWRALLVGSVAERVVRHAPCAVWVARKTETTLPKRIIAATDLSASADRALDVAVELARACAADVSALHVHVPGSGASEQQLRERLARACAARAISVSGRLIVAEHETQAICKHAQETQADLVVVAAHGASALDRMLIGSVSERVVRHAGCSVLVVR